MNLTMEWNCTRLMQSPLFLPLRPVIARLEAASGFPSLQDCNALLEMRDPRITAQSGRPVCFMPQESGRLPFERQYEPRCYLTGEVPTRERNWHDLFNALVWLTFPGAKAAINSNHYHALMDASAPEGSGSQRGAVRDVNTLFDESGVIVAYADAVLADLLRNFKWKELFWQRREEANGILHIGARSVRKGA